MPSQKKKRYNIWCPSELNISGLCEYWRMLWVNLGLSDRGLEACKSMDMTLQIMLSPSYYLVFIKTKGPLPQPLRTHALAPDHGFCVCFCCISTWSSLERFQTASRTVIHLASEALELHPLLQWVAESLFLLSKAMD